MSGSSGTTKFLPVEPPAAGIIPQLSFSLATWMAGCAVREKFGTELLLHNHTIAVLQNKVHDDTLIVTSTFILPLSRLKYEL